MRRSLLALIRLIVGLCALTSFADDAHWQVIEQPQYRLIFPESIRDEADRVASLLDQYLRQHEMELPLKQAQKQVPIVLYAQSHTANGNVGLMPFRSRWYNKPAPFAGLEWFDALAVHEGRHIVQFNQVYDNDIGQALSWMFGDIGAAGFALLFVPAWYLEGDAVVAETTLTQGGRGRIAAFDLWFRTAALTQPDLTYDQAMFGTGFDNVPYLSPYVLGYFLTSYLRTEISPLIFDQVVDQLGDFDGFNFNGSLKHLTGKTLEQHYANMVAQRRQQWQQQIAQLKLTPVQSLRPTQTHWQSFYPIYADADNVIAVSVDVERGDQLMSVQDGNVQTLVDLPKSVSSAFYSGSKTQGVSSNGQKHCWVAQTPHPSKPFQESGNLFCWASEDGLQQLTKNDKLTEVEITANGFVAHRFSAQRESELVWFNQQGQALKTLALPMHSLAHDLSQNEHGLVFVLSNSSANGVYRLSDNQENIELLMPAQDEQLRSPQLTQHWLLYTSDRSGIDQLMATSRHNQQTFQIASRPYGSYYPHWSSWREAIVFADYTPQGQQLVAIPFIDSIEPAMDWIPLANINPRIIAAQALVGLTDKVLLTDTDYTATDFHLASELWNPHSWGMSLAAETINAFVRSDDILEKLSLSINAGYQLMDNEWLGGFSARYRLDAGPYVTAQWQRQINPLGLVASNSTLGLAQPFTFQRGSMSTLLSVETGIKLKSIMDDRVFLSADFRTEKDRAFQMLDTPLGFHQLAYLDVNRSLKTRSLLSTDIALPGITNRQSLNTRLNVQHIADGESLIVDTSVLPAITSTGISGMSAVDYRWNLGPTGRSFTSALYWRNTEVSINARGRYEREQWQTAYGVTVQPAFNVLHNANLRLNPRLSVYYLPERHTYTTTVGVSLFGF